MALPPGPPGMSEIATTTERNRTVRHPTSGVPATPAAPAKSGMPWMKGASPQPASTHGYGHGIGQRSGVHRLSGSKSAHRVGKR